jgi:hypothetical protein
LSSIVAVAIINNNGYRHLTSWLALSNGKNTVTHWNDLAGSSCKQFKQQQSQDDKALAHCLFIFTKVNASNWQQMKAWN